MAAFVMLDMVHVNKWNWLNVIRYACSTDLESVLQWAWPIVASTGFGSCSWLCSTSYLGTLYSCFCKVKGKTLSPFSSQAVLVIIKIKPYPCCIWCIILFLFWTFVLFKQSLFIKLMICKNVFLQLWVFTLCVSSSITVSLQHKLHHSQQCHDWLQRINSVVPFPAGAMAKYYP